MPLQPSSLNLFVNIRYYLLFAFLHCAHACDSIIRRNHRRMARKRTGMRFATDDKYMNLQRHTSHVNECAYETARYAVGMWRRIFLNYQLNLIVFSYRVRIKSSFAYNRSRCRDCLEISHSRACGTQNWSQNCITHNFITAWLAYVQQTTWTHSSPLLRTLIFVLIGRT